ncbi:MAG: D-alanyl-D-alanine carboxypeptidase [Actinomycetota bacterium]|nr:D-alanyl-D-alanine carboxypeptidase [Actinomycetota bacterium]
MRPRPLTAFVGACAVALATLGLSAVGAGAESEEPPVSLVAAQAAVRPRVATVPATPLIPVVRGLLPEAAGIDSAIEDELADEWLGPRLSLTVRDVASGEHLVDQAPDRRVTPASLAKLLTAAAVATTLPLDEPFHTRVVQGAEPGEIVLVAGGDMLLAVGAGDPEAVDGRAGLGDLAEQVADSLDTPGRGAGGPGSQVILRLDMTYAAGDRFAPGWSDFWIDQGYAGAISMLGLSRDRAFPLAPAPRRPSQAAGMAFHQVLEDAGVDVAGEPGDPVEHTRAPAEPVVFAEVSSAPARDVLALALSDSDNALIEQLVRQAAVLDGVDTDHAAVTGWVVERVADYGIDTTGVELADLSGLSDGTTIPVRVIADVLVAASDGSTPELQGALAELPIAGYTGTLGNRFHLDVHTPAVGIARAKTGSLPRVTALAGLVVTRDDRLLVYAMVADRTGLDGAALEARSVLDEIVTELASCGC